MIPWKKKNSTSTRLDEKIGQGQQLQKNITGKKQTNKNKK